jgi:hypothetical protein
MLTFVRHKSGTAPDLKKFVLMSLEIYRANIKSHEPCEIPIIGAPEKLKNWPRPLFRLRTNHTCHQKPNSSFRGVKGSDPDSNNL